MNIDNIKRNKYKIALILLVFLFAVIVFFSLITADSACAPSTSGFSPLIPSYKEKCKEGLAYNPSSYFYLSVSTVFLFSIFLAFFTDSREKIKGFIFVLLIYMFLFLLDQFIPVLLPIERYASSRDLEYYFVRGVTKQDGIKYILRFLKEGIISGIIFFHFPWIFTYLKVKRGKYNYSIGFYIFLLIISGVYSILMFTLWISNR